MKKLTSKVTTTTTGVLTLLFMWLTALVSNLSPFLSGIFAALAMVFLTWTHHKLTRAERTKTPFNIGVKNDKNKR